MRAYLAPAALLVLSLAAPQSPAQCYRPIYVPQAPNACGPGFYEINSEGALHGPSYYLRPDFLPFQGMVTPPKSPYQKGAAGKGYPGMAQGPGGYPGMQGGPGGYPGMVRGPGGYPGMQSGPGGYQGAGPGGQGNNLPGMQPLPNLPGVQGQLGQLPPLPGLPGLPPVPAMAPFQGIAGQAGPPRFMNHPFARSPRDFFMLD